jgi:hypothetical protein
LGAREVQAAVLEAVKSDRLAVYAVWMPVLRSDSPDALPDAYTVLPDSRVSHFWDSEKQYGKYYGSRIDLPEGRLAWDVYLLFDGNADWGTTPPMPVSWWHQLKMRDGRRLDGKALRARVEELLKGVSE